MEALAHEIIASGLDAANLGAFALIAGGLWRLDRRLVEIETVLKQKEKDNG